MSDSQTYHLDRLYYGVLVDENQQQSSRPGVIARTASVTPAQIAECLRVGQILPPASKDASADMPGTLALLQSNTTNFILTKAQRSDAGYPQIMYVLVPREVIRQLGGNVLMFRALGLAPMPAFVSASADLPPFEFRAPPPPERENQLDALFDLMLFCQDSLPIIEGMLAALVQGWPLVISNSPRSITQRLQFVQGLLSLLPVPARTGITFATHVTDPAASPAQLMFAARVDGAEGTLVYDWARGELLTKPPRDAYSRYIISQLRLDPSLVVDQTEELARTTVWRAMQRERLSSVLAWVARRAAVDRTVRDGQPADRALVASILREDPTLSPEARLAYVRHLLAFALALREPDSADVIPVVATTHPAIVETVSEQLRAACDQGHASLVYEMLSRWLLNIPEAAALPWHDVLHYAAEKRFEALLSEDDLAPAQDFLIGMQNAHPALHMQQALPQLFRAAQPIARENGNLAHAMLVLGAEVLPAASFQQLLSDPALIQHFPPDFRAAIGTLLGEARPTASGTLERAGKVFGDIGPLMTARLAEWAVYQQRTDLIDAACLGAVLALARSSRGAPPALVEHITRDFTDLPQFLHLAPPGHQTLIELLFQMRQPDRAISLLERCQNELFGSERLNEFTRFAGNLAQSLTLPTSDLIAALERLDGSRLRPEPRAAMLQSALRGQQWREDLDYAAQRLTAMLAERPPLIRVVGAENTLKLLSYQVRVENGLSALRVGTALTQEALHEGSASIPLMAQMWHVIAWNSGMAQAVLELLRRYVRGIPLEDAPRALRYFEREIGLDPARELHATILVRRIIGEQTLPEFVESVCLAAALLTDLAATYHADKVHPPLHRLRRDIDQMTGNLTDSQRQQVSRNTLALTQQVYELGQQRTRRALRQPAHPQLIEGTIMPRSGVDFLRFAGGHFARHIQLPLILDREEMAHLFGSRSAAMFLRETTIITQLLSRLQAAFRVGNDAVTPEALQAELESLWNTLPAATQHHLHDDFAVACQQLAEVITLISERSSDRVLGSSGFSRQLDAGQRQPHTALEALRWISGYFARTHQRQ